LALKGCSPGQGPRWSREPGEEGGAAERGWEGPTAAPSPSPALLGAGGSERRACYYFLSFFLTIQIYFN